jgi:hypothetical protein
VGTVVIMSEPATAPETLTIASRFNGPPTSGNGGYVAGLLAARVGAPAVTVTLRQPPPLERALAVVRGQDAIGLYDGELLVAEAVAAEDPDGFEPVDPVPFETAVETSETYFTGRDEHPFPTCFVCGSARKEGDGLRLFPGMVPQRPGTTACAWVPDDSLTGSDGAHVRPEFVWAALDCPGGWTALGPADVLVLGRITVRIDALPYPGERCVLMGRLLGREGRKVRTATTLYDADGRVAAHADATWIAPRAD